VTHKTPATILLWIVALLTLAASTGCSKASARKSKLNDQQKWALAASAIPKKANDMELDIMGGGEPNADYVKTLLEMLKSDWEVTDRASALNAIKSLREQGHRADFNLMLKHVSKLDDNGFTRFLIQNAREPELRNQFKLVYAHRNSIGNKSIIAWDYCRLIYLAECAFRAGYLTEKEAWAEIMPATRIIQATFSSWRDMSDNYLLGREFWSGSTEPRIIEATRYLLSAPQSPWSTLPWKLPLNVQIGLSSPGMTTNPAYAVFKHNTA
jgi:hypothetical protein